MHRFVLVTVLGIAPIVAAQNQEIWVDAVMGNDANPGTASMPVRSITQGCALANGGDTVTIRPGLYSGGATGELLPIKMGQTAPQPNVRIRGLEAVYIDLEGQQNTAFVLTDGASGGRLTNLRFVNADLTQWWTKAIESARNLTNYEIDHCIFDGVNRGIILWEASPDVSGVRIHHNLFVNLGNDAINAFEKEGANEISNNTIIGRVMGTNYVGILVESPSARIVNNLIVGMRDAFATGTGASPASFVANDTWMNSRNWVGGITTPPTGNFAVDPLFLVGSGYDFQLQSTSPLRDAGAAVAPTKDLADHSVPIDSDRSGSVEAEVGAFELAAVSMVAGYDAVAKVARLGVIGPAGSPATILFALDDGAFALPGFPAILLDPATLLPFATPPANLPISLQFPITPPPPGYRLVMQAIAVDAGTLQPSNQTWLQW